MILMLMVLIIPASAQNSFEVVKSGKGHPVLLLPGFACTSEVYNGLTEELVKNYEVHAFTFAGFGGLPPIGFPWLPKIKEDIELYVQENHLKKPTIIGHSLGGTLGLWLAADSDMFSKLVIVDALPAMGALMLPDYNSDSIAYDTPYNQGILEMDEAAFNNMAVQSAGYMTRNCEKQHKIADWIKASDRETYVYGYTDLLKLDLRQSLKSIKIPVHILAATEPYGRVAAEATYTEQYKNLNDYNLKFAEGSGHFIMYDQPEWLLSEIQFALKKNE